MEGVIRSATTWLLFVFACLFGAGADVASGLTDASRSLQTASPSTVRALRTEDGRVADDARPTTERFEDEASDDDDGDNRDPAKASSTPHGRRLRLAEHIRAHDAFAAPGCEASFRAEDAWPQRATPSRGPPELQG
ncbi:MAG: hypothetical protein RLZZ383_1821 [Pseudomonadota bacterium]